MMKNRVKLVVIITLMAAIAVFSCKRIDEYPPEPVITYLDFEKLLNPVDSIYDRGVLKFSYTDGDGNIGLNKGDTFPPFNPGSQYYYNLVINYFEVRNGVETEVPLTFYNASTQQFDTVYLSARIPPLVPKGTERSISGDIYDTLFIYNYNSEYDTLFLEFYIVDRALNKSNMLRTDYIVRRLS
jgi:hypothetical protein